MYAPLSPCAWVLPKRMCVCVPAQFALEAERMCSYTGDTVAVVVGGSNIHD